APAAQEPAAAPVERWVQVHAGKLEQLVEQLSGFAASFQALHFRLRTGEGVTGPQLRAVLEDLDRCQTQLNEVSDAAWGMRLVPVEPMLVQLGDHARGLALDQGKRVRVVVQASGAQLERGVLDALTEPLLHLVRNAVDHGLERPSERGDKPPEATLRLSAEPQGQGVVITVTDDGRGVDPRKVRAAAVARKVLDAQRAEQLSDEAAVDLIFLHGFSTRSEVTDVSGRGVGLDVVRAAVDALGGSVAVGSRVGTGTTFTLNVPGTISRERVLVMEFDGVLYGLPSRQVAELRRLAPDAVEPVVGGAVVRVHDETLPLRDLSAVLGGQRVKEPWLLVVESGHRRWALSAPLVLGEYELLRRPVDAAVAAQGAIGASGTLEDGRLVLVLSLVGLLRRLDDGRGVRAPIPSRPAPSRGPPRVLLVDDSPVVRDLLHDMLSHAGYRVTTASDGKAALAVLEKGAPDVVVSDVDMPVMNGFQLLQALRQRWPTLPVIMLTTRASVEDRERASNLGADAYLVKSQFEEMALVETLRRYVGSAA
ncbi:MAG: response regulator, partial [Myxococcota bacterium]